MVPENLSETISVCGDVRSHIHCDQTKRIVIRVGPSVGSILVDRIVLKIPRQITIARGIREEIVLLRNQPLNTTKSGRRSKHTTLKGEVVVAPPGGRLFTFYCKSV